MAITNTTVVDSTDKHIVQSKGIGGEEDQILVDAEKLTDGNNKSISQFDRVLFSNKRNWHYDY